MGKERLGTCFTLWVSSYMCKYPVVLLGSSFQMRETERCLTALGQDPLKYLERMPIRMIHLPFTDFLSSQDFYKNWNDSSA